MREEHGIVGGEVLRDEVLVFCEELSESGESISADFEAALVDPLEEVPEDALACLPFPNIHPVELYSFLARLALII